MHSRARLIDPLPHVTLHSVHSDHSRQPGGGGVGTVVVGVLVVGGAVVVVFDALVVGIDVVLGANPTASPTVVKTTNKETITPHIILVWRFNF